MKIEPVVFNNLESSDSKSTPKREVVFWKDLEGKYKYTINEYVNRYLNGKILQDCQYEKEGNTVYFRYICTYKDITGEHVAVFDPQYQGDYKVVYSINELPSAIGTKYVYKLQNVRYIMKKSRTEYHVVLQSGEVDRWVEGFDWYKVNEQNSKGELPVKNITSETMNDRQKAVLDLIKSGNQFQIENLTEKAEIEELISAGLVTVEYKVVEKKENKVDLSVLPNPIVKYYNDANCLDSIIKIDYITGDNPNVVSPEITVHYKDNSKSTWKFIDGNWKLIDKQQEKKPKAIFHKLPKSIEDYYAYSIHDINTVEEKVNQITIYLTNGTHDVWQTSTNRGWIRVA